MKQFWRKLVHKKISSFVLLTYLYNWFFLLSYLGRFIVFVFFFFKSTISTPPIPPYSHSPQTGILRTGQTRVFNSRITL